MVYVTPQIHRGPGKEVLEMIRPVGMPEKWPRNLCESLSSSLRMITNNVSLLLSLLAQSLSVPSAALAASKEPDVCLSCPCQVSVKHWQEDYRAVAGTLYSSPPCLLLLRNSLLLRHSDDLLCVVTSQTQLSWQTWKKKQNGFIWSNVKNIAWSILCGLMHSIPFLVKDHLSFFQVLNHWWFGVGVAKGWVDQKHNSNYSVTGICP